MLQVGRDQGPEPCGKEPAKGYQGTQGTVREVGLERHRVSNAVPGKGLQEV